ncbi:hypothetical protein CHLNCDRAFT_142893 [Chlorella variabilis]|uniref:Uncharacterized protein n=1 Tax=Chlorella variabilis TaxID=554065 RepID=E1Z902_CHLVA|nr:hypothetical protein CHLNCDRAFT_142893 [Chlorella variabilis]EFN57694.1 hypothetical protein CHLNCDRAFT_142893 [Chlorella variabilis]|eukprot:XP_005849796.1 hypothetical protein CHLNCDRAFT_142893 [Chlorella variabilis]
MEPTTRVLLLPIFRRHWLWHAEGGAAAAAAAAADVQGKAGQALRNWREGRNLEEKVQLLGQRANRWVQRRLWTEWHKLETASEGTLRNRGYRMAQAVLAREDPRETFLKNLPSKPAPVEVIYPTAYKERMVRRQLRHVAADGRRRHTMRLVWWMLAMVPQLPLMLTPLPNITVYYTGYRIYSHFRALQGTKALEQNLEQLNSKQLRDLRDQLLIYQERHSGFQFRPGEWPAKLIRKEHRYLDMLEKMARMERLRELQRQREQDGEAGESPLAQPHAQRAPAPLLTFTPSVELNELVRPMDRLHVPLGDEAAVAVGKLFHYT